MYTPLVFSIANNNQTALPKKKKHFLCCLCRKLACKVVAMEVYPESIYQTNFIKEDEDDGDFEDALSLCDLPIYSGSFESSADDFHSLDHEEDQFEFFSTTQFHEQEEEDHFTTKTSTTSAPADDIIFCGKLIPYKTPQSSHLQTNNSKQQQQQQSPKKKSIFSWNSTTSQPENTAKPRSINNNSHNNKALSSVLTSQTKSRWNLFMFGLVRIPTEMELSDIRNRQHRRTQSSSSSSMFGSFEEDDKQMTKGGKKRGKGLWGLLKFLGCTSYHTNTVVKASFGCISSV